MFSKSIWIITSVSSSVFLFSFCFHDLFIDESGVLKSPTISGEVQICDLSCSSVSFTNFGVLMFGA